MKLAGYKTTYENMYTNNQLEDVMEETPFTSIIAGDQVQRSKPRGTDLRG